MFIETRGNDKQRSSKVEFSQAILNPSASYGGLYVPMELPSVDEDWLSAAKDLSYKELCFDILKKFNLDIEDDILKKAIDLYDGFDDKNNPVPLNQINSKTYVNELYHGVSRAFKDMALQPFGYLLSNLAKKQNQDYLILAATSGDTGPATLESFKNKPNIKVVCLYPDGGTSDVQRLQMVTNEAENVKVIGIKGNFDDAQRALKELLSSDKFKKSLEQKRIRLSAANSVNFGRIIFQIIYHFSAYLKLLNSEVIKSGEQIYLTIPSGNFGNALGAYYAKHMGLPIKKILVASNINNILTELFTTGVYDISNRKLLSTTSPAMDILISSNVERLLFDKFGAVRCKELMNDLKKYKKYKLTQSELLVLQEEFGACYCDDEFVKKTIKKYAKNSYALDPHTATCLKASSLVEDGFINVIASTAEWTKFAPTMLNAINDSNVKYTDEVALDEFSQTMDVQITKSITKLFDKDVVHTLVVEKDEILSHIEEFLR